MKKLLVTALAVMATLSIYAQGTVNFGNIGGAKIKLDNGTTVADCPVVTAPNNFQVQLYYGAVGAAESAFTAMGTPANLLLAGTVNAGTVSTTTAGTYQFQVRGWGNGSNSGYTGKSTIWTMATGDPNASPAVPAASITLAGRFTGLTLNQVPEPSTIALGLLGLAGLFVLRRRN